jgi:hypothetical protein
MNLYCALPGRSCGTSRAQPEWRLKWPLARTTWIIALPNFCAILLISTGMVFFQVGPELLGVCSNPIQSDYQTFPSPS